MWSIPVAGNCFPVRPPPHAFCPVIRLLEIVYINWALEIRFDPVCLFLFLSPRYFSESRLLILSLPSSTVSQSLPFAIAETHFSLTRLINVRRSRYRVSRQTLIFSPTTTIVHSLFLSFSVFLSLFLSGNYTRTRTNSLKWRKNSRVSLQAIIRLPLSLLSRITFYPVQSSGTQ